MICSVPLVILLPVSALLLLHPRCVASGEDKAERCDAEIMAEPLGNEPRRLANATVVFLHLVSDDVADHSFPMIWPHGCELKWFQDRRKRNMVNFRRHLPVFQERFLDKFRYPVTVLYSPFDGVEADLAEMKSLLAGSDVETVSLPSFGKDNFHPPLQHKYGEYSDTCRMGILAKQRGECFIDFAYKQMNYIFTYAMFFGTSALSKYRYWMRVDAEVDLHESPTEDPFVVMEQNGWIFSYYGETPHSACDKGLPAALREFVALQHITPPNQTFYEDYMDRNIHWPGFIGAGDLSFFQGLQYRSAIEYILQTGGIWKYRWDDQHLYAQVSAIFLPRSQTGQLSMNLTHR